jgi:hypothetical protein
MLEILIDNIFAMFGGRVFQQTVAIPMDTNSAPLLADLFLYSYEANFIQGLLKKNEKRKSYGRHHDLVDRYGISLSQMTTDIFYLSHTLPDPFLIHDLLPDL